MNIVIEYLLAMLFVLVAVSCSHITDSTSEIAEPRLETPSLDSDIIPDFIIEKSNQIVMSFVGDNFFQRHYSFDSIRSQYYDANQWCIDHPSDCLQFLQHPHYLVVYTLKVNDRTVKNSIAEFVVDTTGNLIAEREIFGIPNCVNSPGECVFIDEASAIAIAKDVGLEAGIREWKISFSWFAREAKTFVWVISNTLTETGPPEHTSGGRTVVIDANSGTVIEFVDWIAIGG